MLRISTALLALVPQHGLFPSHSEPKDIAIDAATKSSVIEHSLAALDKSYVFPDVAKSMAAAIHEREKKKEYDSITSALAFADKLTSDLQAVSRDKHLRLRYREETLPPEPREDASKEHDEHGPSPEEVAQFRAEAARENFGFVKVERLDGNIGYIDFRRFTPAAIAGERVATVMNFVSDCDALIFDMRKNGGGAPDQIALICSYLFDGPESVHLNDIYFRPTNETQQFWTTPWVPGKKFTKDVYVLTSNYTFSGAEEFTYDLKTQKRATIVGETTGGGANPGDMQRVDDHFALFVPMGRAINPITKTNWEGTGVEPDVKIAAERALEKAQILALDKLISKGDGDPLTEERKQLLEKLDRELAGPEKKI